MPQPKSSTISAVHDGAPEPHEAERARKLELLAKVRITREKISLTRGHIQGMDPKKVYHWVNRMEDRQIEFQTMGWEICSESSAPQVQSPYRREDGTHRRGDLILYQIDRDLQEAIESDNSIRAIEGVDGPKKAFVDFIESTGAMPYEPQTK